MESPIEAHPPLTAEERTLATLEMMGQGELDGVELDSGLETLMHPVRFTDRVRRLPEAVLLTAGYYASRLPMLNGLIRRLD